MSLVTPSLPQTLRRSRMRTTQRIGLDLEFTIDELAAAKDEIDRLPVEPQSMGFRREAMAALRRRIDALTNL